MARSSRAVYEDFQPRVDEKEEQRANVLAIHLPGFAREQMNVTYVDSTRTIQVQGERPLAGRKRSRFNRSFPVPQDCIPEKIQGSFRNGILTLTIPKKTITEAVPAEVASTSEEASPPKPTISPQKPTKDQKETTTPTKPASTSTSTSTKPASASTSGVEKQREDQKIKPPQTPQKVATETKGPIPTGPQTSSSKAQTNEKKKVEISQPSKQQEDTPKKAAPTPTATTSKQTEEKTEIAGGKVESKLGLKNVVKEKESDKTKDSPTTQTSIPKILEKGKKDDKAAAGALDKKPTEGGGGGGSLLEKAKEMKGMDTIMKTVKKLTTDDYEDRQLLLNIGVSVLVIVALGAYITYSYRSSAKTRH